MGKYIIDVGDAYTKHICGKGDMLCLPVRINEFEDNWLNTNIPLTPYTEPDIEKVREEAYEKGRKEAEDHYEKGYNDGYDTGLSHAWEAARNVVALSTVDRRKVFGSEYMYSILEKHTAAEAIEKIRQHEQEKEKSEEQKKQESIAAEDVMRQYLDNFCRGRKCTGCPLHTPDFTCGRGKYFLYDSMSNEEIRRAYFTVLAKMKEE